MEQGQYRISIGGKLPQKLVEEFCEAIREAYLGLDWGATFVDCFRPRTSEDLLFGIDEVGVLTFYSDDAVWGHCKEFEEWLRAHGLSYDYWSGDVAEFGPMEAYWRPGMEEELTVGSSEGEDPLVGAVSVIVALRLLRDGDTEGAKEKLESLVGKLDALPPLPKFEIVKPKGKKAK